MKQKNQTNIIYREVQKFTQIWLWVIVFIITGLIWYAFIQQLLFQIPFGYKSMSNLLLLIFWIFFGICLPAWLLFARLTVEVRHDDIYLRYFPFHLSFRKISIEQLKRYEITTYRSIRDFGGWGIRYGLKGKKAYNVEGNRGVLLEFLNGKQLLIGSQRPEEFVLAIQRIPK
jgi:hypothetical protein